MRVGQFLVVFFFFCCCCCVLFQSQSFVSVTKATDTWGQYVTGLIKYRKRLKLSTFAGMAKSFF